MMYLAILTEGSLSQNLFRKVLTQAVFFTRTAVHSNNDTVWVQNAYVSTKFFVWLSNDN